MPSSIRRARGFSLLEVLIAYSLLAGLLVLVLTTVQLSSRPITDTTFRSQMTTQGSQLMTRLVRELEGGSNLEVGTLVASPLGLTADATDDDAGTAEVFTGRAIRYQVPTGWDAATEEPILEPPEPLTTNPYILAFVSDASSPNGNLKLVQYLPGGLEVTLLRNIDDGGGSDPPNQPYFRLTTPSELEVVYTIERQVDYKTTGGAQFARVQFRKTINLRNLNQW